MLRARRSVCELTEVTVFFLPINMIPKVGADDARVQADGCQASLG
jgi:hypothetical protein